jgi:hypothetical protein
MNDTRNAEKKVLALVGNYKCQQKLGKTPAISH